MENKESANQKEIFDLDQLRQIAGGAETDTSEVHPNEIVILLDFVRYQKHRGDTLEKVVEDIQTSKCKPDRKVAYVAAVRQEWENL